MLSPLKLYCKRNTLIQCAQPMHEAFHRITPMTIMPVMGYSSCLSFCLLGWRIVTLFAGQKFRPKSFRLLICEEQRKKYRKESFWGFC